MKSLSFVSRVIVSAAVSAFGAGGACGAPQLAGWTADGPDDVAAVAASAFSGFYATADTFEDRVEVRDVRGAMVRTISREEMGGLLPWMSLDGGADGPAALAMSASGRMLFVSVFDDTAAGDGQPSDAVLRLDVSTGALSVFARLELFGSGAAFPHLAMAHNKGRLFIGDSTGVIRVWSAGGNTSAGFSIGNWTVPGATTIRGIAIDRDGLSIYTASATGVFRAAIPASAGTQPTWTQVASGSDLRALAWGEHFGGIANAGLYLLSGTGAGSKVEFLTVAQAQGGAVATPSGYLVSGATWHDVSATGDGALLIGADEDGLRVTDSSDARLGFDGWMSNEFAQVTAFSKGLIAPDGEPAGWVIDGDVIPAWSRFHPATPDGAAWVVFNLIVSDRMLGDGQALPLVRSILTRYGGLAADGIKPWRSADGIMKHWLDPLTGNTKPGWADEYATLSTMKIVAAAARAMAYWPDDPVVARAGSRIVFLTRNWGAYLQGGTDAIAFKGLAGGGADPSLWASPFNEGIIFAEQAGTYGGSAAAESRDRWFERALWPVGATLLNRPITSAGSGQFQSAFLSVYPSLLSRPFRADAAWREQIENIHWSNAAWTDDNGPRFFTVFSAGTSPSGYNADTLSNHPGNIATFPSLMGLAAFGDESVAVGAYHAYRKGARQAFKTGASLLYRRSDTDRNYVPNSAGLPDVVLGALGLAELMSPGVVDEVLARPYPTVELCPQDVDGDGEIDVDDLYRANAALSDLNGDGSVSAADRSCLQAWLRRGGAGE
ncbi:MAG: hypothetical protein JNK58_10470 [Phycisphaerae bacterium]|nr:hypothetical protein [Phycisphaerae bacterium]